MTQTTKILCCALLGSFASPSLAAIISPASYDLTNGQTGAFSYLDGTYSPSDLNTVPLAPLTGGKGELTDGFAPTTPWQETPGPYVGWLTIDPAFRFHFDQPARVDSVTLFISDTLGTGGVNAPTEVTIANESTSITQPISNPSGDPVFSVTVSDLQMTGQAFDVLVQRGEGWVMLSEVQIDGEFVPEPRGIAMMLVALIALGVKRRS